MRLTLRTLLAWIDDTLPPSQVREIGNQVAESPFAQELVERIRRVTRQRRLTVPRSSGAESIDPNLEASYLDNDLDAEQVAEFEKQCLSIDVCLAEVASVHQILSLLGQRAKVPREVKERMYQLVKGREAIPPSGLESRAASKPMQITRTIQPWIERESVSRSRRETFILLAGCLTSLVILGTSAWYGLSTSPISPSLAMVQPSDTKPVDESTSPDSDLENPGMIAENEEDPSNRVDSTIAKETAELPSAPDVIASTNTPKVGDTAKPQPPSAPSSETMPLLPPGAIGRTEKGENVLLRYSDEKREWERLTEPTPLRTSDRLACLSPFRATLDLASTALTLMEGSEIKLAAPTAEGRSRFELRKGRFKAVKIPRGTSFVMDLDAKESLTLDLSDTNALGIERLGHRSPGDPGEKPATWTIYCGEGKLSISRGEKKQSFDAPVVITVNSAGMIESRNGESPPVWVGENDPSPADRELRDQFLRCFHAGRPVLAEIVTATEDGQDSIRRLAISALMTLGDLSYVMPLLDRKDAPTIRRETIAALREFMSLGAEAAQQVKGQILEEFGESTGPIVEKMLIGYTPEEAAAPGTLRELISYLEPDTPSVGVRELSLDNLMKLSGRDHLGYDPDQPGGSGLTNWKKLLNEGKLLPESVTPPAK